MAKAKSQTVYDPIDLVNDALQCTWDALCRGYDLTTRQPDWQALFHNTTLDNPEQAAETLLANMLLEVTESVDRFSPWYRLPARSFGLVSLRDQVSARTRWVLTPEARLRWQTELAQICAAVTDARAVLKAILLVEDLMGDYPLHDPPMIVQCQCNPPHAIQIKQSIHCQTEIVCEDCRQPFE